MISRELTHPEVDALWHAADKSGYPPEVVQSAYASLLRGVGLRDSEYTRLATGTGRRPYVCPFRGPRFRYSSPERLIETAIPWLLRFTDRLRQEHLERMERRDMMSGGQS